MSHDELSRFIRDIQARHRAGGEQVRGRHVPYRRRGEMSIPAFTMPPGGNPATDGHAASLRLMQKAGTLPVDLFFFDCEDGAPDHPDFKRHARLFAAEALTSFDFGDRIAGFRPNNIRSQHFEEDIVEVVTRAGDRIRVMIIPKTETASEVRDIISIVRQVQKLAGHTNRILFEVLIESPRAFLQAGAIAAIDDVTALILGSFDLAKAIGGTVDHATWMEDQAVARQSLPLIAAAHGKEAVDAITAQLPIRPARPPDMAEATYRSAITSEVSTLRKDDFPREFYAALTRRSDAMALAHREAQSARRCGYAAKWILHPDQIAPVQSAWTPDRETAMSALNLVAGFARSALSGSGVGLSGNRLADKAVVATDWWLVRAALEEGVITEEDILATGLSREKLEASVRAV